LRMKTSDVKYITNRWPLIEKRMTRNDCVNWLERHGLEVPLKSSCYFCPFHSTAEWRKIFYFGDSDWQKAVEVDKQIRKARPPYDLYLHPARIIRLTCGARSRRGRCHCGTQNVQEYAESSPPHRRVSGERVITGTCTHTCSGGGLWKILM